MILFSIGLEPKISIGNLRTGQVHLAKPCLRLKNLSQICRELGFWLACDTALFDNWRTDQLGPGTSGEAALPGLGAGTLPDFGRHLAMPGLGPG